MKFKLTDTPRYWWPVTVRMPSPDQPGKIVNQTLKLLFEPQSRSAAIDEAEALASLENPRDRAEAEMRQLKGVVTNWDDVTDDDGGAVAFSDEAFARALEFTWFRTAVYAAYAESLAGEEARLGN